MAATGRTDWRSRHMYSSYDSYYSCGEGGPPPPSHSSYSGGVNTYYGTPRGGGRAPPPHQHSPIVPRLPGDPEYFYNESPHTRPMSPTPSGPPQGAYERHPSFSPAPYRTQRPMQRSQVIHRGTPPFSSRGASSSANSTPRIHPGQSHHGPQPGYYPESPYPLRSRPPMGRMAMPLHRQHLPPLPRNAGSAPWEPPSPTESQKKAMERRAAEQQYVTTTASREDADAEEPEAEESENEDEEEKEGGDALVLLAKVSSDMETKPGEKAKQKQAETKPAATAPPTSPLTRRTRSSPVITPTTDNTSSKRKAAVSIHPSFPEVPAPPRSGAPPPLGGGKGPKAVTPMPPYYPPTHGDEPPRGPPPHHYNGPPPSRNAPGYRPYPHPPTHGARLPPVSWHRDSELGPPSSHPAVVERHSFDSIDSAGSMGSDSLPPPAHRYYGAPRGYGAPPPLHDWSSSPRGPPPPGRPYAPPRYMYGGGNGNPPPPPGSGESYGMAPYSYVQQAHLDERTVLRRKFSWKHYPELERFLIANRDAYLEHSSKNYTAEQKQYNNWLTERLLQVAEQHNYIFDPEEFNFVAIRDRIRCYYKSYVQTARKRGMELPGKAHIKKHRPANALDKYAEEKDKKMRQEQEKSEELRSHDEGDEFDEEDGEHSGDEIAKETISSALVNQDESGGSSENQKTAKSE